MNETTNPDDGTKAEKIFGAIDSCFEKVQEALQTARAIEEKVLGTGTPKSEVDDKEKTPEAGFMSIASGKLKRLYLQILNLRDVLTSIEKEF